MARRRRQQQQQEQLPWHAEAWACCTGLQAKATSAGAARGGPLRGSEGCSGFRFVAWGWIGLAMGSCRCVRVGGRSSSGGSSGVESCICLLMRSLPYSGWRSRGPLTAGFRCLLRWCPGIMGIWRSSIDGSGGGSGGTGERRWVLGVPLKQHCCAAEGKRLSLPVDSAHGNVQSVRPGDRPFAVLSADLPLVWVLARALLSSNLSRPAAPPRMVACCAFEVHSLYTALRQAASCATGAPGQGSAAAIWGWQASASRLIAGGAGLS